MGFFRNRLPTPLALMLLIAGCSASSAVSVPRQPESRAERSAEADWEPVFVDIEGSEARPADDPKMQAVALVFILRDCPIANSYLPELNRLHEVFSDRGVLLALVHVDSATSIEQARAHASEYQIRPLVVLDPRHEWVAKAGATVSPETVVFSRAGEIVYRGRIDDQFVGLGKRRSVVTSHDLKDALEAVLAGQPVSQPRTEAVGCPIPKRSSGE